MLKVVQVGLGPIGQAIAALATRVPGWRLVGAVDPDPGRAGCDLGGSPAGRSPGIAVDVSIEAVLSRERPDLALHATGSSLPQVAAQLEPLLAAGMHVVSTCEELSFPFHTHPETARRLDRVAREAGVVLLGTGVNPGFVMDKLVATLMGACTRVDAVRVRRVLDAATRRAPFQRKIGAGMSPEAFESRRQAGGLGHVGLAESAHMLGEVMGLGPRRTIRETLRPVIAQVPVSSRVVSVQAGQVAGIHQTAILEVDGVERVSLELQMYLGAERPLDAASIAGNPGLEMEIAGGVAGDEGTAAVTVNSAALAPGLAPGLRTMLDVPLRPAPLVASAGST